MDLSPEEGVRDRAGEEAAAAVTGPQGWVTGVTQSKACAGAPATPGSPERTASGSLPAGAGRRDGTRSGGKGQGQVPTMQKCPRAGAAGGHARRKPVVHALRLLGTGDPDGVRS